MVLSSFDERDNNKMMACLVSWITGMHEVPFCQSLANMNEIEYRMNLSLTLNHMTKFRTCPN